MADNVDHEIVKYDTYGAMDRSAMWMDIPIWPGLAALFLGLIVLVIVGNAFNWKWGAGCSVPFFIAIFAMRSMTAFDDKFMRRLGFMIARKWLELLYGRHLFLSTFNPQWSQEYGKRNAQQCLVADKAQSAKDTISDR